MEKIIPYFRNHYVFLIFLLVGSIVYWNILDNTFVWLDTVYIVNNQQAYSLNIPSLFTASALTSVGHYRPIVASYFVLVQTLFGNNPLIFHVVQILLHIVNAYLVFLLFRKFFTRSLALFGSLIFLLHPMNEGKVAFISATADVVFMTFGLLAFLFVFRERSRWWEIGLTLLLLLLSILSKEAGILFILIIPIYRYLFKKTQRIVYVLVGGSTMLLYILVRYLFHGFYLEKIYGLPFDNVQFFDKLKSIPEMVFFYMYHFFYPYNMAGLHLWTVARLTRDNFYQPLLWDMVFLFFIGLFGIYVYKKYHTFFKPFLLFFLMLVSGLGLYMQIISLDYTVSARWFNFAMIGLIGIFLIGVSTIKIKNDYLKYFILFLGTLYLIFLGFRSINKNNYWQDEISLFTQYAKNSDNYIVENLLANAYLNQNEFVQAMDHAKKSVAMKQYDNNLALLASLYERGGDMVTANRYYEKSLAARSLGPYEHDNITAQILIRYLLLAGKNTPAVQLLNKGLLHYPQEGGLWVLKAINEYQLGYIKEAHEALQIAGKYYADKRLLMYLSNIIKTKQALNVREIL